MRASLGARPAFSLLGYSLLVPRFLLAMSGNNEPSWPFKAQTTASARDVAGGACTVGWRVRYLATVSRG